jgi:hypothetical protein
MTCKLSSRQPSDVWGIDDSAVAYAFDAAATHVHFIAETELENARLEAMAVANTAATLGAMGGSGSPDDSGEDIYLDGQFIGKKNSSPPAPVCPNMSDPVWHDGHYCGYGESIPMTKEEFTKRMRAEAPPDANWYRGRTAATPRIL